MHPQQSLQRPESLQRQIRQGKRLRLKRRISFRFSVLRILRAEDVCQAARKASVRREHRASVRQGMCRASVRSRVRQASVLQEM